MENKEINPICEKQDHPETERLQPVVYGPPSWYEKEEPRPIEKPEEEKGERPQPLVYGPPSWFRRRSGREKRARILKGVLLGVVLAGIVIVIVLLAR